MQIALRKKQLFGEKRDNCTKKAPISNKNMHTTPCTNAFTNPESAASIHVQTALI